MNDDKDMDAPMTPTPTKRGEECYCVCHSEVSSRAVCLHCERAVAVAVASTRIQVVEELIDRLRDAMDTYNSLPENATEFAFYLKVKDIKAFFDALKATQGGKVD